MANKKQPQNLERKEKQVKEGVQQPGQEAARDADPAFSTVPLYNAAQMENPGAPEHREERGPGCCKCDFCVDPEAENLCDSGENNDCHVCMKARKMLEVQIMLEREVYRNELDDLEETQQKVVATLKKEVDETARRLVDATHAVAELDQGILEARRAELEELHKKQTTAALKARVAELQDALKDMRVKQADADRRLEEAKERQADRRRERAVRKGEEPGFEYSVKLEGEGKKAKRKKKWSALPL